MTAAPSAAAPEVLSLWSADSVGVGAVLDALDGLRRSEDLPSTRTTVLTLVIVATAPAPAERAQAAVYELGGRHPARLVTLLVEPGAEGPGPCARAEVRLLGGRTGGRELWFESVELTVAGEVAAHLDSLLVPLTLPDLPVVAWFPEGLPDPGDPLLGAADTLLVDTRALEADQLPALAALAGGGCCVVDLSWVRMKPWRLLLAGLFEGPDFLPFVDHVRRADVWGRSGPRHLLAGWVGERLGLGPEALELAPAEHAGIRLEARRPDGSEARFEVIRSQSRVVQARASITGGPTAEAVVSLPEATPAWGLAEALAHLEPDPVYIEALRRAAAL